jgi:hypothetical protein
MVNLPVKNGKNENSCPVPKVPAKAMAPLATLRNDIPGGTKKKGSCPWPHGQPQNFYKLLNDLSSNPSQFGAGQVPGTAAGLVL